MDAAYSTGTRFETKRIESENLDWVRKEYLKYYIPFDLPFALDISTAMTEQWKILKQITDLNRNN